MQRPSMHKKAKHIVPTILYFWETGSLYASQAVCFIGK